MKTLTIFPSTGKLAKKFLLPILGIIGIYFFVVVPDEDIGVGSGGFFTFMTYVLGLSCIAFLIAYFYQLKIAKSKPILSMNKEKATFTRKNIKVNFAPDVVFTLSDTNHIGPPTDAGAMDFIVDKRESYITIWKNEKKLAKVKATFMNLPSEMVAALLNDVNQAEAEEREKVIESFHQKLTEKGNSELKERIQLQVAS